MVSYSLSAFKRWWSRVPAGMIARFQRYIKVARWLFHDSLMRFRRDTIQVVVLRSLSVAGQLTSVVILMLSIRALETGDRFQVLGWTIEARSVEVLSAFLGVLCAALLVMVFGDFLARQKAVTLMCEYETFCLKRLIARTSRLPHPATPQANDYVSGITNALVRLQKDARYAGLVLRQCLLSIAPLLQVLIYGLALWYLEPKVLAMILALVAVGVWFLYRQSLYGAKCSLAIERLNRPAGVERLRMMKMVRAAPLPLELGDERIKRFFDGGAFKALNDAIYGRLRVILQTDLTAKLLTVLGVASVVTVLGIRAIEENSGWGLLIVYVLVLRACFTSGRAVTVAITSMNRYYPQVSRYVAFIDASEPAFDEFEIVPPRELRLRVPCLDGSMEHLVVPREIPLGLMTPRPIGRGSLIPLWSALEVVPERARFSFLGATHVVSLVDIEISLSVIRSAGPSRTIDRQALVDRLSDAGLSTSDLEDLPADLNETLNSASLSQIHNDRLSAALALISATEASAQTIAIDAAVLYALPAVAASELLKGLVNRFVVILYDHCPTEPASFGIQYYLLSDGQNALAWVASSSVREHKTEIDNRLARLQPERRAMIEERIEEEEFADDM